MSTTSEYPQLLEIDTGDKINAVTFTSNGAYLISGGEKGVRVWQVKDGKQVAAMPVEGAAWCVATSKDGRFIAAGTIRGGVFVWDATTYKRVFADGIKSTITNDVDFSPDSTTLVSAHINGTAVVWNIAARQSVQTLGHNSALAAAKYSPQGDRIATATGKSVRVWDSSDGRILVDIRLSIKRFRDLLWCDHFFVKTNDKKLKQFDVITKSTISEWPVPDAESRIALPQHGKFVVCSTKNTITFWYTSTRTQPSPIQHTHDIRSIACSPHGQLLAFAAEGKIVIKDLSSIIFPPLPEPELCIDSAALNAWKHGQLTDAEVLLSAAMSTSKSRTYHTLASRALVRARLGEWDSAIVDADESIRIYRTLVAYVAKCIALVGKGEKDKGFRLCDIAFQHFPSDHLPLLLLIKAVVLSVAREHVDAISRMDDLITDAWVDPGLYVVQAYMHRLHGDSHMESGDYERAIQSLEDARVKLGNRTRQPPLIVSLISGWEFDGLATTIKQHLCEALLAAGCTKDAGQSILRMVAEEVNMTEPTKTWVSDFKYRCCSKLESLGDNAMNVRQYDVAISHYTVALSLDPPNLQDLLVKRSKSRAGKGLWGDALSDANEVIKLDPSSPLGYERKHQALRGAGHGSDATAAFEMMLLKMSKSPDPEIREQSRHYVRPEMTQETIYTTIRSAVRDSPLFLIHVNTGRLCNKSEQISAFKSMPIFTELICSMTTDIDHTLIGQAVGKFYRYATFSHTWEGNERLFETVTKIVVYDLEASPAHNKLKMFCKIVGDEGFDWAWSDTCCINQSDPSILQESLIRMFRWYEGSGMTIIFLFDVDQLAELGALTSSRWNLRGWTLQEYHASKVVRIYTKDWTPYLGLTIHNHKESPEVISEMEEATGISAQALMALRPGLNNIREKLRLASTRQTTRVEDAAYSLLGIFSISLSVAYGEEDKALGRLLSQLLTSSGDTSILAWSGRSGSFNSCLPTDIVVFSQPPTSHIPPAITDAEMEKIITGLRASSLDLSLATKLFDQVNGLSLPFFVMQRMKLPCITFETRLVSGYQNGSEFVFRAWAGALGNVEIKTRQNLSRLDSLYLVHPWIDFLLDRRPARNLTIEESSGSGKFPLFPDLSTASNTTDCLDLNLPPAAPPMDKQTRVHHFLARLRRPFGALLLTPTRLNVEEYKRVATESLITVQVGDITLAMLEELMEGVRVLDVL